MQLGTLAVILVGIVLVALAAAVVAVAFFGGHRKTQVRELLRGVLSSTAQPIKRKKLTAEDIEILKAKTRLKRDQGSFTSVLFRSGSEANRRTKVDSTRFFQAGLFTSEDRRKFFYFQIISPIVWLVISTGIMVFIGTSPMITTLGMILGLFIGFTLPQTWLDRKIEERTGEIQYFLPVVIEQISIGVSSSLDIWPCISHILEMARQRNSHNPVTELMMYVEKLISSGLSLQDGLYEVAQASGVRQIKHTFRYLGQVAEHGGEISKQLMELADAVMVERQSDVEERISALPVKATGPLFMVFSGYFALMLAGIFVKLLTAFPEH